MREINKNALLLILTLKYIIMKKLFFTMLAVAFCATSFGQEFDNLYTLPSYGNTINFNNTSKIGYRVINEDDGSYSGLLNFQYKSQLTDPPYGNIMSFRGQLVGIGTNYPEARFHVAGTTFLSGQTKISASNTKNNVVGITGRFGDKFVYNNYNINTSGFGLYEVPVLTDPAGEPTYNSYVSGEKGISLFTDSESRMRITYDGNVGVGVDNPTSKFQVNGDVNPSIKLMNETNGRWIDLGLSNCNGCFSPLSSDGDAVMRVVTGANDFLLTNVGTGSTIFANGTWGSEEISMVINNDGKVGIGSVNPDEMLTVKGKIHAEEVKVDLNVPADYVFEKYYNGSSELKNDYNMPTLEEVEAFTKANNHLPEIPSAIEIQKNGLELSMMTNLLLQKIEELTLYTIEQEKRINRLEAELLKK